VCTSCGIIGADARPNWRAQTERPSLTGTQWRSGLLQGRNLGKM
jgi:hypothetical protein